MNTKLNNVSGQALIELVAVLVILVVLAFGMIDFGRFIYERQILVNVTREGSNLASRGTTLSNAVTAVVNSAQPLNINSRGRIIMSTVYNSNGVLRITSRVSQGGITANSRIGSGVGVVPTLPATATPIPPPSQTLFVTEVFYRYTPITPIGRFIGTTFPSNIYDVAFF